VQYLGGKQRIANWVVYHLEEARKDRPYLEPFIGAANIFTKMRGGRIGSDIHPDLILLLIAIRDGTIELPTSVSEEEYQRIRREPPSALRGFVGFGCSFSGKFFGGYSRDPKSNRSYAANSAATLPLLKHGLQATELRNCDYRQHDPKGYLIYCDPPYAGTTKYSHDFDHGIFWETMRQWARHNTVIVSEYTAPSDFRCLAERQSGKLQWRNAQDQRTERLFTL